MLRGVRWSLYSSFLISAILHLIPIVSRFELPEEEKQVRRKPLAVKFIQRAPRLVKPLELMRRPTVVQRQLQRRVTRRKSITPRSMRTAAVHGGTALASLARPAEAIDRSLFRPPRVDLGPQLIAGVVENTKESGVASLSEDLLPADALDTGRYASFATQNPGNKQDISGFIYMALIRYRTDFRDSGGEPDWNTSPRALPNVAEYLNDNTGIKADFEGVFTLDDKRLMERRVPFLFMTGHATFEVSKQECEALGRYLRAGGFIFIDDSGFMEEGAFNRSARGMLKVALGEDAVYERLPSQHRLYHCYYDFDGPPPGDDNVSTYTLAGFRSKRVYEYLEGVFLDGRMAVLFSQKSYNNAWNNDPHWRTSGNVRQLQFGVNIVVFLLTQSGGFTQQQAQYQ